MFIQADIPSVVLAPMDGVTDFVMREYLTSFLPFSYCVSEFVRVNDTPTSPRTFYRSVPELRTKSVTRSGTPVQVQILGGDPDRMAESAQVAVRCGARGIDINFGCPAPTVNRHDGGATLLKFPERIERIVHAVRSAVPRDIPVSAKLRLGWDDPRAILVNAERAARGGVSWITIHGRTKVQGYMPPAYWKPIGEVRRALSVPVVANGELWSLDDFKRCQEESGAIHFMIGRGALAEPSVVEQAARYLRIQGTSGTTNESVLMPRVTPRFADDALVWREAFTQVCQIAIREGEGDKRILARIKQWLNYASKKGEVSFFDTVKRSQQVSELLDALGALSTACPGGVYEARPT